MNGLMKKFEIELYNLINNSNLQIGEAYYILKCALLDLEKLYNQAVDEDSEEKSHQIETKEIDVPYPENQEIDLTGNMKQYLENQESLGEKGEQTNAEQ